MYSISRRAPFLLFTASLLFLFAALTGTASAALTLKPASNFPAGNGAFSVAIGDLNGDGRPDLATANQFSDNVSVLLGTGTGSFGAKTDFAAGNGPFSVAIGDLNGDGRPDLATANFNSDNVSVLLGTGTGSFGAKTDFPAGANPLSVAIGDLNNDGRPDLATANALSDNVSVLLGPAPARSAPRPTSRPATVRSRWRSPT